MAKVEHHIPWKIPYAYTSIVYDTDTEEVLDDNKMAELLNHAQTMEILAEQAGYAPAVHPMVAEAVSRGAVPTPPPFANPQNNVPAMRNPATSQQTPEQAPSCENCGGATAWGKWRNNPRGGEIRFPECTSGCTNDRGYALSGRPQTRGGR